MAKIEKGTQREKMEHKRDNRSKSEEKYLREKMVLFFCLFVAKATTRLAILHNLKERALVGERKRYRETPLLPLQQK